MEKTMIHCLHEPMNHNIQKHDDTAYCLGFTTRHPSGNGGIR